MRQQKSKLICKCGTKGGVLTLRQAGNSKTKNSLYIQHYDRTRKAGKRSCYISKQNIALIKLNDKRYDQEYKPLVKEYFEAMWNDTPEDETKTDNIVKRALLLLIDMGWPHKIVDALDKFWADRTEVHVMETVSRYKDEVGIKVTREQVFKKHFQRRQPRFKINESEEKWWNEVAKRGRMLLKEG